MLWFMNYVLRKGQGSVLPHTGLNRPGGTCTLKQENLSEGNKVDSGINMTGKTTYNRRFGQINTWKNDPKYMYFYRLGEIFEKISSPISVSICPGPVITMTGTPESIPGSTKWDDRENII